MLGHLRSRAFENYKEALEKSIINGEEFDVAYSQCTESVMSQFDEDCAGRLCVGCSLFQSIYLDLEDGKMILALAV